MAPDAQVIIPNRPEDAPSSADYMVTVNGTPVHVYDCEAAAYTTWDFEGTVEVTVAVRENHKDIVVRPHHNGPAITWDGSVARFTLDCPRCLCFDPPWQVRKPLFIYANGIDHDRPDPSDPKVRYFEAGRIHDAGVISLESNETLYIEGGAIVRGRVEAFDAHNVRVAGHGILDATHNGPRRQRLMYFGKCVDVDIRGIITIGSPSWTIVLHRCKNCHVDNVKQIGWVVTSDGIDVVSSHDVLIENCCLRNNDDCVVVKAFPGYRKAITEDEDAPVSINVENVEVRNCVLFNAQSGNVMEIGYELRAEHVRNVHFHDCDVIASHGHGGVFTIHNGDRALVEDILYENIRVEHYFEQLIDFRVLRSRYSRDEERGRIRNVTLRNIQALDNHYNSVSLIGGWDADHAVEDITLDNVVVGGKKATGPADLQMFTNEFTGGILFH